MLWGNAGNDRLEGDTGPDRLLGGPDDDTVWGGEGLDRLWGGWGLDILSGDGGSSPADEGADDILSIENDGVADEIDCGPGRDRAVIRADGLRDGLRARRSHRSLSLTAA